MQCPLFSSRNLTVFFTSQNLEKLVIWYLNCLQNFIWKIFIFAPPADGSVSQKNSSPSSNEIMQQNGRLFGDGTPPNTFVVVCFLNQIQFTNCTIDLNHVLYESPVDSCLNRVSVQHQYILSVDDFWSVKRNQCLMQILHFGPLTLHSLDWNYDNDVTSLCSSPQCIFIYWIQILLGHI